MKDTKSNDLSLLELATHVMTCARTSIEEGQRYSVLRFLEIFKRIAELPKEVNELKEEPLLTEIRAEIDKARHNELLATDEQRIEFTDKMIRTLTAELKKRSEL